jgi:glycerol-3-phosphate dehydrogenase (NAD(P)+)
MQMPSAVVVASVQGAVARTVQEALATPYFRAYTNDDVLGVEIGGALKNVVAIACGVSDGLGLGHNTRAAIITRGLAEITRLAIKLGAKPLTFAGLAGMGDLVLTCTGDLSRNRTVGMRLGKGETLDQILASMRMVAEGVRTTRSAHELAVKLYVDMPLTAQIHAMLYKGQSPRGALAALMGRDLKPELAGIAW